MYRRNTTSVSRGLFSPTAVLRAVRHHQQQQQASSSSTGATATGSFDAPLFMGSSTANVVTTTAVIEELEKAELTHVVPSKVSDHASIHGIRLLRWFSDKLFKERYIHRAFMLVGVGHAPPAAMVAVEHMRSHFKDEAPKGLRVNLGVWENRRIHHAIVNQLSPPSVADRCLMAVIQVLHSMLFLILSIVSPRTAYRLAAYLSEEATVLLTHMVNDLDLGKVQDVDAPALAVEYWGLQAQSSGGNSGNDIIGDSMPGSPIHARKGGAGDEGGGSGLGNTTEKILAAGGSPMPSGANGNTAEVELFPNTVTPPKKTAPNPVPPPTMADNASMTSEQAPSTINAFASSVSSTSSPPQERSKRVPRLREVVLLMRADEMVHRDVYHRIADAYDEAKLKKDPTVLKNKSL